MAYFYDVVNTLASLYVSYRGRYVVAKDGKYFTPHNFENGEFKSLDNKALISHLNHQYAVGVFASRYNSKFVCFDVDLPDPHVVHEIIDALCEFGFPKEQIYVSSSGGKGYHVEMFFTDLVYLNLLHDLYLWVIEKKNLDPKKVEFRPTYTQAIKLPLGKHHKTGNICWYLDRDTLVPIEDQGYVMKIIPMDRDAAEDLIRSHNKKNPSFYNEPLPAKEYTPIDSSLLRYDEDPVLTAPGSRHNTMKSIAVRERYKDTPQEEIEAKLKEWARKQNPEYITDPWGVVMEDAERLAHDVWKPTFVIKGRNVTFSPSDMRTLLSCHSPFQKRVLFLIMIYAKRYGEAHISSAKMARIVGCSLQGLYKALSYLEDCGLISKKQGKRSYHDGKFVSGSNSYVYKPCLNSHEPCSCEPCLSHELCSVDWDFKEETFKEVYLKTMRDNVPQADWKKYFTKKELEELCDS